MFDLIDAHFLDILVYPQLHIDKNCMTFIVGESGSGKSTLLTLLNGTAPLSKGQILYNGKDINQLDTITLRKEVILAGQQVFLFDLSIRENFQAFFRYRELAAPLDDKIIELLHICHISFDLNTNCATLSGGERQRIYIAIALSLMPSVIMLDEPTSALDSPTATALMQDIKDYCTAQKITAIVVSHDQNLTRQFADAVITL